MNFNLYGPLMLLTDAASDRRLVAAAADVVQVPRAEPANSFVLHAPLELVARTALLPRVAPERRAEARQRIRELASNYDATSPALPPPPAREFETLAAAAARLHDAVEAADLDEVDAIGAWLGRHATPADLRTLLADEVLTRLSAAAHAPIFLFHLPRVAPRGELPGELVRPLLRELARFPSWRIEWIDDGSRAGEPRLEPAARMFDAVAAAPRLGIPGSDFIFPLMSQVDRSGVAASLLADAVGTGDFAGAARDALRAAAWSMVHEPPDHAPYGWSHCLTMPQAVLGIAHVTSDPRRALAVAATYVVGFRAALAQLPLIDHAPPVATDAQHAFDDVATAAAVHEDAHLVKYVLACIDAAAWDRSHAGLYLEAARALVRYWTG